MILSTLAEWIEMSSDRYRDAFALATATIDGHPSVRMVSLRGIERDAIRFFTGHLSRKGRELEKNPHAAALFFFPSIRRQVRLEGMVSRLSDEESDEYFRSRPLSHRQSCASWIQGTPIASLEDLKRRTDDPPRPHHWGGYRLVVRAWETWIGGDSRMHERQRCEDGVLTKLAP